ncbi:hypothetical protein [Moorena sp. SIO4G3]|uniref:hypothetical protein n=1 Tax=Moorena sp. SIO4G3 TaxID=2607821 RepID=UPI0014298144|nr:hypothetical protein [Moorena sp. SIO4G3]NEO79330.1 hypothetical protein [Moorena sp. SIO4G3]
MSILSELQSRELGLIELLLMGFDIYLKNIKSILVLFCLIFLLQIIILVLIIILIFSQLLFFEDIGFILGFIYLIAILFTPLRAIFLLITFMSIIPMLGFENIEFIFGFFALTSLLVLIDLMNTTPIYNIAISVITDNYVHGINISYQSVLKKIFSSLNSILCLGFIYQVNFLLRAMMLLVIPGIIYRINNLYYGSAFILRDQRGKAAFTYSRSIVKGNCYKVFVFSFLFSFISIFLLFFISGALGLLFSIVIIFFNTFGAFLVSGALSLVSVILSLFLYFSSQMVVIIGSILLFLNLEYQKKVES